MSCLSAFTTSYLEYAVESAPPGLSPNCFHFKRQQHGSFSMFFDHRANLAWFQWSALLVDSKSQPDLLAYLGSVRRAEIDYLIDKNRIHNWIFDSRKQIANCENYCRDGCGKCLYHADPTCHPVWPHELGKTYVLPNSLLSRDLAKQFIDFC